MGILTTKSLQNRTGTVDVPVAELNNRIIKRYEATYTGGEWNPTTTYNWVPGSFVDYTPLRADSRISYIWRIPHAWVAASHAISHARFYVNGKIYYYHSISGVHIEDGCTIKWDVPSWGTGAGRIGYQIRSYANDNHEVRYYTTYYWNGTGRSAQNARGQLIVEEYTGVSMPAIQGNNTFTTAG